MQRLYSTFARGWPGMGLLLLRLIILVAAIHYAVTGLASAPTFSRIAIEGPAVLLLCAGLWTPIAGGALSVLAFWSAFSGWGDPWGQAVLAAIAAALAMLGPGAWSIDARLFGRKRLIRQPLKRERI